MFVSMAIGTIEDTFLLKPTIPTTSAIILNEKQFPYVSLGHSITKSLKRDQALIGNVYSGHSKT